MQFKIFFVSEYDDGSELELLNKFLRTHKILQVQQQFLQKEQTVVWYFCVQYIENSEIPDRNKGVRSNPEENLSVDELAIYTLLKEARAKIADAENVKRFIIFNNEELSRMACLPEMTVEKINETEGIHKSKKEKYLTKLIDVYNQLKIGNNVGDEKF